MSSQKYSREYLTNLPIEMRKQYVEQQCQEKIHAILAEARQGKTGTLVSIPEPPAGKRGTVMYSQNQGTPWCSTPPSKDEMVAFLKETFPDCKITYEEKWIETSPGKKELKKGILVDWT
jgi:hypothetical protein